MTADMLRRDSPSTYFSGYVLLPAHLNFDQYCAWEDAIAEMSQQKNITRKHRALVPGLVAVVAEWRLAHFPEVVTVDNFPATPATARLELVTWLLGEVMAVVHAEQSIPNG